MPKGNLEVQVTDMAGEAINSRLDFDLQPFTGDLGTSGDSMSGHVQMGAATELSITGISCRGGPGTMYRLLATAPHYRPYSFFQLIREGVPNQAADDIEFWVSPADVTGILAPEFSELSPHLQEILTNARMTVDKPEDRDLAGRSGADLYAQLGPLRQAGLLNIAKKADHQTAAKCFPLVGELLICRQDRVFAMVDSELPGLLKNSPSFSSAPGALHKPLSGFEMTGESFKSRDPHANLQVTFQRRTDGALAADIDIDESTGIQHGVEVIRNATFRSRTNPYLIREFLLAADHLEHTLDPGYRFEF